MGIEMTGSTCGQGAAVGGATLDVGNPLEALADTIGEALGLALEPGSVFAPSPPNAPQWQIEAGS
jgi:hypothetical protein